MKKIVPSSPDQVRLKRLRQRLRLPLTRKEEAEFAKARKEFLICSNCPAVFWKKSWHRDFPAQISEKRNITFGLCPACLMSKKKLFEGEVLVKHIPEKQSIEELVAFIRHIEDRALKHDILDRILELKKRGRTLVVRTSENELALRLARRIQKLLGGKLNIVWSDDEDTVRITWNPDKKS